MKCDTFGQVGASGGILGSWCLKRAAMQVASDRTVMLSSSDAAGEHHDGPSQVRKYFLWRRCPKISGVLRRPGFAAAVASQSSVYATSAATRRLARSKPAHASVVSLALARPYKAVGALMIARTASDSRRGGSTTLAPTSFAHRVLPFRTATSGRPSLCSPRPMFPSADSTAVCGRAPYGPGTTMAFHGACKSGGHRSRHGRPKAQGRAWPEE